MRIPFFFLVALFYFCQPLVAHPFSRPGAATQSSLLSKSPMIWRDKEQQMCLLACSPAPQLVQACPSALTSSTCQGQIVLRRRDDHGIAHGTWHMVHGTLADIALYRGPLRGCHGTGRSTNNTGVSSFTP
jgi:hypothetical protein